MNDTAEESSTIRGRRISRRGAGLAFSNSGLSDSTVAEGGNVNSAVEGMASRPAAALPPPQREAQTGGTIAGSPSDEFNPGDRLAQVRSRSTEYEREYRLNLLHRLLMRNIPLDEIAAQLGISVSQVYRDREELKRKLREASKTLDIDEIVGDSKGFYEEAAAMAMRAASNASVPMPMRLAAIRTGLAATNDKHRFFQTAGVYDVLRYKLPQDGSGGSDIQRLMEATERLLNGEGADFSSPADSGSQENIDL